MSKIRSTLSCSLPKLKSPKQYLLSRYSRCLLPCLQQMGGQDQAQQIPNQYRFTQRPSIRSTWNERQEGKGCNYPIFYYRIIKLLFFLFLFSFMPCGAWAKNIEQPHKSTKTALDVFLSGGLLMWPLLLCSAGTAAISVYCLLQINRRKVMPSGQAEAALQYLRIGDTPNAYAACQNWSTIFSVVLSASLLKVNYDRDLANKHSMEQAAEEALAAEETKLMLWINYLNVFATIAPMLGLLGTVTGMISSFDQLALGKAEPSDLAGGISEAMVTTAGGLIVGIPAMFAYFYFRNLLVISLSKVQSQISFLIDVVSGELRLESTQ